MSATDDAVLAAGVRWLATKRVTLGVVSFLLVVFAFEVLVLWRFGATGWAYLFLAHLEPTPGLVMAPFAHRNLSHLLTTLPLVLIYGGLVEMRIRDSTVFAFYVVAGYASILAQLLTYATGTPGLGTLGASGAALGLVALYTVGTLKEAVRTPGQVTAVHGVFTGTGLFIIATMLVNDFVPGITLAAGTAGLGHAGGMLVGVCYGLVRTQQQRGDDPSERA
jgi:membrane associated rhomboid family serine protease